VRKVKAGHGQHHHNADQDDPCALTHGFPPPPDVDAL